MVGHGSSKTEALGAIQLVDAVDALRGAAATFERSRYPQIAMVLATAARELAALADATLSEQLQAAARACGDVRTTATQGRLTG